MNNNSYRCWVILSNIWGKLRAMLMHIRWLRVMGLVFYKAKKYKVDDNKSFIRIQNYINKILFII
jgi:hypothetical protein